MKILVAGAGAMGATFGHVLHKGGNDVTLCDKWEENLAAVKARGLKITDVDKKEDSPLKMYHPSEVSGDFDLVLFFTKSMQLEDMIADVKHLVKENTKVLCLLNGLGHLETLRKHFDDKHILMGVTVCTAKLLGPGEFLLSSHSNTEIKNIDPNEEQACKAVIKAFNDSTMPATYSEDIAFSTWRKACLNGMTNTVCALLNMNMRQQGQMDDSKEIVRQIITEFAAAAALEGVHFDVDQFTEWGYSFLTPSFAGVDHYPSMWQDLVANQRPTEVDYLNGYVARKLKAAGQWAPYCELITRFIHGREKVQGIPYTFVK
ncbi:2-dehydropantoate 2-reductase [Psittacicella melopsittaci]|uniref:2-dehydropantoate 2-reductase n=1 Tax=Psittacicella melopsittaci TaxID=2028576 RepID=A0A3A1Y3K5_9GAMM|nr:2-dehydropantoate 2-reductase [Psittacicella melopsittaci]RIY32145.1 2-dehydropantoate 2-reductase [Psittacicella melopsittaci]